MDCDQTGNTTAHAADILRCARMILARMLRYGGQIPQVALLHSAIRTIQAEYTQQEIGTIAMLNRVFGMCWDDACDWWVESHGSPHMRQRELKRFRKRHRRMFHAIATVDTRKATDPELARINAHCAGSVA